MNNNSKKIFLIGFMGSGKSTIGSQLAGALNCKFIDLDRLVEVELGQTIAQIFSSAGEDVFRTEENKILGRVINIQDDAVIACGGGTPCYFDNMELMNKYGTTVYLKTSTAELVRRLSNDDGDRPLIKNKCVEDLMEFVETQLKNREQFYNKAKIVMPENFKIDELINFL